MLTLGDIRIGVSGWTYSPWRGAFYPKALPQKRELSYAASQFNALEINGTFYGMQVPPSFTAWAEATPPGFVFAVKGPRYLTHMLKLTRIEAPLANFFASGPLALGEKLGPILWQFPARFPFDEARLARFFEMLPRTRGQAATLAGQHDHRLRAPPHLAFEADGPIRHAIEIRNESFRDPRFIALLRKHDVALVCADTPKWPLLMDVTADFVYCRLHGSTELYNSRYTDAELDRWAARIRAWSTGAPVTDGNYIRAPLADGRPRDVYVFFDNTDKLEAPGNARGLMARLGVAAEHRSGSAVPA
jgi:uncharacterized protein YecE (DUF72 family)